MRAALFAIIGICASTVGQELSTDIIHSEDELYLWWQQGVVDSVEYERLREIILSGVDSTTIHWLDYIPNLSWFAPLAADLSTCLEQRQRQAFEQDAEEITRPIGGRFRYRLSHELDSTDQIRQRFWLWVDVASGWQASARLQRDSNGDDRLAYRSIRWRPVARGWLRELVLGNYSRRLGLGTVVGYRGKLLDHVQSLSAEALLHPDYGGNNGAYIENRCGEYSISTVLSHQRNAQFALITVASEFARAVGGLRPRIVLGYNRLGLRRADGYLGDTKVSFGGRYRYNGGYVDGEGTAQAGSRAGLSAIVFEGKHRFSQAQVEYSGWSYSDDFIDLSSGSRAAAMSRRDSLSQVGFGVTTKRQGQEGLLVRTIVLPARRWRLASSVLAASFNRKFVNLQLLATLSYDVAQQFSMQLRYLNKTRRRPDDDGEIVRQQFQLDGQFSAGKLDFRAWIGYNASSNRVDFLSLFGDMKFREPELGQLHLCGRLSELDAESLRVTRWYAFAWLSQSVFEDFNFGVRFTHQYNRGSSSPHRNMITLEARARW